MVVGLPIDQIIGGSVIIGLGVFGSMVNITVIVMMLKLSINRHAFGYICVIHLIADTYELLISIFWSGPATIIGLNANFTGSFVGARIGQLILFFWYMSLYSNLQMAINRFVAITWPMSYRLYFTGRRLVLFNGFFWVLSFLHSVVYWWRDCEYYFDATKFSWVYRGQSCEYIASFYLVFVHGVVTCAVIVVINTATFVSIKRGMRMLQGKRNSIEEMRLVRRNIRLYVQGCLTASTAILAMISYQIAAVFASERIHIMLVTVTNWQLAHTVDGFIMLTLNSSLRSFFSKTVLRRNVRTVTSTAVF
ncbi:hypothetical protein Q1695_013856 [Nippostrongylus brasiliensis]|nr:hypothetical protein Q1695_013856 [Nippostrongylus brasiliensis]